MRNTVTNNYPAPDTAPAPEVLERRFLLPKFSGIDYRAPGWMVPESGLVLARQCAVNDRGTLITFPTTSSGINVGATIVALYSFKTPTHTKAIIVTTAGIKLGYPAVATVRNIVDLTGPALSVTPGAIVTFSVWNSTTLLMTSAETGMIAIDLNTNTYSVVAGAPTGASFITVMNGRVLLTGFELLSNRIQWSAKFAYDVWSDTTLGTGFEDRVPTGATSGAVFGVYPATDIVGIVLRDGSVEQIEATDNFDAPFRFTQRYSHLLTYLPKTIAEIPDGIICGVYGDVVRITLDGITRIGGNLAISLAATQSAAIGVYLPGLDAYVIGPFTAAISTPGDLFVYWLKHGVWTSFYPASGTTTPTSIVGVSGLLSSAYSSLSGTYGNLTGTLDTLGIATDGFGQFMLGSGNLVYMYPTLAGECGAPVIRLPEIEPNKPENSITLVSVHLGMRAITTSPMTVTELNTNTVVDTYTPTLTAAVQVANMYKTLTTRSLSLQITCNPGLGSSIAGLIRFDYVLVRYTEGPMEVSGYVA